MERSEAGKRTEEKTAAASGDISRWLQLLAADDIIRPLKRGTAERQVVFAHFDIRSAPDDKNAGWDAAGKVSRGQTGELSRLSRWRMVH